ncbi:MAG: GGDEF domain-containing protein [Spirochaetales bacterium]|nr:GGDEF domain-containing protein [Spirochaetales bacterium]
MYEQVLDAINLGIVIIDANYKVKEWNRWMEIQSRIDKKDIIDTNIFNHYPNLKSASFMRSCKSVLKFGNYVFFSQKLHKYLFPLMVTGVYSKSFDYMQQSCSMTPLRDNDGNVTNIVITVQNVTENVFLEKSLKAMVLEDGLTGIYNRRYLDKRLEEEFFRFKRTGRSLSLIMLDIDDFKKINDTYGHPFGDTVLKRIAETCMSVTRDSDVLARFGGEEFCLILPESERAGALAFGERLRKAIADLKIPFNKAGKDISLTASLGISVVDSQTESGAALLKEADAALYFSKKNGKNMVKDYTKDCDYEQTNSK